MPNQPTDQTMFTDTNFKVLAAALAAILTLGVGSVAAADGAQTESSASITILESLDVTQQQAMDFGHVHRPNQGQNTLMLAHDDDTVTTEGTGDAEYVEGTSSNGLFEIQGSADETIQMSVVAGDFEDASISLDETFIDGYDDEATGILDESGHHTAGVGGAVTIDEDASLGSHEADVQVTVEYE